MAAAQLVKKYVGVPLWNLNLNAQRKDLLSVPAKINHATVPISNYMLQAETFFNAAVLSVAYYYDVILHTGNRFGAGTDANVFLKLHGEKGSTEEIRLPSKIGDLERGMINKYKVSAQDLGNLKKVDIRHDNTGIGPAWFLDKVTVRDHSGSRYIFDYGQWLLKRTGENKLGAQLKLSEQNLDQLSSYKGISIDYTKLTEDEHLDAVEKTVHKNLSGVLQGIIQSASNSSSDDSLVDFVTDDSSGAKVDIPNLSDVLMLPSARLLVEAFGLAKKNIQKTGPKGHLLKEDVLRYVAVNNITRPKLHQIQSTAGRVEKKASPAKIDVPRSTKEVSKKPEAPVQRKSIQSQMFEDTYFSGEEKANANQYRISKSSIPHVYSTYECNIDNVSRIQDNLLKQGISVPVDAFLLKASALALKAVPEMNVNYVNGAATTLSNADISVTLVNAEKGVIRPILKKVHEMRLQQVAEALKDVENSAHSSNLDSEQTASFSISNLGSFGVSEFCEIITPPQVCIMAVGASQMAPSSENNVCKMLTITLSCDGRLIDEATASKFMNSFKKFIENPHVYMG